MSQNEKLLLIGGPLHGEDVIVGGGAGAIVLDDSGREAVYQRRTMRFLARDPRNPRSTSLRRYYVADVMAHDSISDDSAEVYAWWQSLADVRLFEQHGREVTGDSAEVAKFHPVP